MKKDEVKIGGTYQAKVSGRLTEVRITGESRHGGWDAVNVLTNKKVRIKTAARLRGEALHGKAARRKTTKATKATEAPTSAHVAQTAPEAATGTPGTDEAQSANGEWHTAIPYAPPDPTGDAQDAARTPKAKKRAKRADGKMSGIDAAAKVLEEAGTPMTTREMFDAMHIKGYWTSDAPTPYNTLYSAILREIATKGEASRFAKAEQRGNFTLKR